MYEKQEPVVVTDGSHVDDHRLEHPAFGCLKVSRMTSSKGETLFGSPIKANTIVEISLHRAVGSRRGLSEHHYAKGKIASVKMSEMQWATFVSRLNYGDGIPVTMEYGPAEGTPLVRYPDIVRETDSERRQKSINEALEEELSALRKALNRISDIAETKGAVSKVELKDAVRNLQIVTENAPKNFEYAAGQVTKHMEHVEEAVRMELDSYARTLELTSGISALLHEDGENEDDGKVIEG